MAKTSPSNERDAGSISGRRAKIPHASWPKEQNVKLKYYCNELNKDLKKKKNSPLADCPYSKY